MIRALIDDFAKRPVHNSLITVVTALAFICALKGDLHGMMIAGVWLAVLAR